MLVPLVLREDGIYLLLTMRTAHLNDHAEQVASVISINMLSSMVGLEPVGNGLR